MPASPEVHQARRERARALLVGQAAPGDWLLVTTLPNIRYLTGFGGSNAVLALHARDPEADLLGTDGRYAEQVLSQAPGLATLIDRSTLAAVARRIARGSAAVYVESTIALQDWQRVTGVCGFEPMAVDGLIEGLRVIKDEFEIACLEQACRITAQAFEVLLSQIQPGMTEIAIARRLEQLFGDLGAPDRAFATIVGSGPNSAIPHHECSPRIVEPGDLVVIDAGALVEGYHADMTRTAIAGCDPSPWQQEIHEVVRLAQASARNDAVAGVSLADLDASARGPIQEAGYANEFVHGLGHGVGLQIHEAPMISSRASGSISPSTPITIEPGIYLPGRGGVRIEDTVLVESNGPRVLTDLHRDLAILG
jgi:Xaa-Pro dipeptidase